MAPCNEILAERRRLNPTGGGSPDDCTATQRGARSLVTADEREPSGYYAGQDEWQLRCRCSDPAHFYTINDAAHFRQAARDGLIPELPRGALD